MFLFRAKAKQQRLLREVGARAGNPPPALSRALALARSRAASRKSLGRVRAPNERPPTKRAHSALISGDHKKSTQAVSHVLFYFTQSQL